jgi:hypothetical protein
MLVFVSQLCLKKIDAKLQLRLVVDVATVVAVCVVVAVIVDAVVVVAVGVVAVVPRCYFLRMKSL